MATPVQLKEASAINVAQLDDTRRYSQADYQYLVDHTHDNFFANLPLLKGSNTPEKLIQFLFGEAEELKQALQDNKQFIDIVSEMGDLFHFYHDLLKMSDVSIVVLLRSLDHNLEQSTSLQEVRQVFVDPEFLVKQPEEILDGLLIFLEVAKQLDPKDTRVLAIIARYIFTLADRLNIDVIAAALFKNLRNVNKYNNEEGLLSDPNGDYDAARKILVEQWKAKGGDEAFFEEWLEAVPLDDLFAAPRKLTTGVRSPYGTTSGWVIPYEKK